ncbi:MAG: hypothetical protein KAT49_00765 [Methanomicrobia archaeon]|nr:hypothetical protein [Methanomicrobia archaeon]
MDEPTSRKYLIMRDLSRDLGMYSPKLTVGKICKCEIITRGGKILFTGTGGIPDVAIEKCYESLLKHIKKKEGFSPELKNSSSVLKGLCHFLP